MNNIFENAYFGKVYKTRDGRKAIYKATSFIKNYETDTLVQFHKLMVDGGDEDGNDIIAFMNNGKRGTKCQGIDIISEWQEPIEEEKLDKLAIEYGKTIYLEEACCGWEDGAEAFKAGYRAALKQ